MKIFLLFLLLQIVLCWHKFPSMQHTIADNNRFNNRQFAQYNSQGLLRLSYTSGLDTVTAIMKFTMLKRTSTEIFQRLI